MAGHDSPPSHTEEAASVFAAFVCRVEQGEAADIEALCADHPTLAGELRSLHEGWKGVRRQLERSSPRGGATPSGGGPRGTHWRALLEYLGSRPDSSRYEPGDEIGHGGFGVVKKVWDRTLERSLAMKVLHRDETRNVARFLEEAQITAQLDHPGVVPVHELGIDESRHLYFTMKRVRGESFDRVLEKVFEGAGGWTETRALGVLLKACEAVAFAHSRKVVHRDLKPANLMVGHYGETYVMDWGLARLLDPAGAPPAQSLTESTVIRTARRREGSRSPLLTREGDVLGTVNYMAPEQARGAPAGPAADVYSMGAVLYELLARQRPYADGGAEAGDTLERVLAGPPRRIAELNPRALPELMAVAEKAMARDPVERYATMEEMAEDLRAYLEGRVVRAHQTGAFVEFRKWVARNRGTAAALALLLVVTAAAAIALLLQQKQTNAVQARNLAEIRRQADVLLAPELITRAQNLGPIHPDAVPRIDEWLADARDLESRATVYRLELDGLRAGGEPVAEVDPNAPLHAELAGTRRDRENSITDIEEAEARLALPGASEEERARARRDLEELARANEIRDRRIALLEHRVEVDRPWRLPSSDLQARHDFLAPFVSQLDQLFWAGDAIRTDVERRRRLARDLQARTVEQHADEWADAVESIADADLFPPYQGLEITPQIGLVPLGPDPDSGLWEFWHVLSGERPERDADDRLVIGHETGIVLVLVPGGTGFVGAQRDDPSRPNYCKLANGRWECPPKEVFLAPYFLSKYELTQGQWMRATGYNPSRYPAGVDYRHVGVVDWTFPVEQVTWEECRRVLGDWSLVFPTEAQWERAARGTGFQALEGFGFAGATGIRTFGNISDKSQETSGIVVSENQMTDGYPFHAPVHAFACNDFGFFGVAGNVKEWCLDGFCELWEEARLAPGTGEIYNFRGVERAVRGTGYNSRVPDVRVTYRHGLYSRGSDFDIGVRAARSLGDGASEGHGSGE